MYRLVAFDEIEKNKWNGTVHYALNGNIFGYYWYLKAVIGEWDAIVEEDYQSVMPILKTPLKPYQYSLLMELGPYSVNPLTDQRMSNIFDLFEKHNRSSQYPIHTHVSKYQLQAFKLSKRNKAVLPGGTVHEELSKTYSDDFIKNLNIEGYDSVKVSAGLKPEALVNLSDENEWYKNSMMRLMYNAIHRGIGFSSVIEERSTGKILAASFFMSANNSIYEIFSFSKGRKKYRQLIFDLMLRNTSGSPMRFETFHNVNDLHELGFDSESVFDVHLKSSTMTNLRKSLGRAY